MNEQPFTDGDRVRNIHPASRNFGRIGTFRRYLPYDFISPGCDVEYEGETGPYGYPYVAQSVADLVRVEDALLPNGLTSEEQD